MEGQNPADASIMTHFANIPDPRSKDACLHPLSSVITIAICAIICGADSWVAVERWGNAKRGWLATFIDLPHGIPSHDTFTRIFCILNPKAFQLAFESWINAVADVTGHGVLALDGKTLRRSFNKAAGQGPIHMVSAWSCANNAVLGQVKTEEKSNEITAIPKLLQLLEIKGCIVTIDAMGCQKAIAQAIIDADGDYVLAVKDNQPTLYDDVRYVFDVGQGRDFEGMQVDFVATSDRAHGRVEERAAWVTGDLSGLRTLADWPGLKSIAVVESVRTVNGKTSVFHRYFISSLPGDDAKRLLDAVRNHWEVENKLHWSLDLAFREDESRVRKGHGAENLARLRHAALNLLRNETTAKVGIAIKRQMAGWDNDYLLRVLGVGA